MEKIEAAKRSEEVKYGVRMNPMPPPGYALVKRYVLLSGASYDGSGWGDYVDSFTSIREAKMAGNRLVDEIQHNDRDWYQVIDLDTMTVVRKGESEYS